MRLSSSTAPPASLTVRENRALSASASPAPTTWARHTRPRTRTPRREQRDREAAGAEDEAADGVAHVVHAAVHARGGDDERRHAGEQERDGTDRAARGEGPRDHRDGSVEDDRGGDVTRREAV